MNFLTKSIITVILFYCPAIHADLNPGFDISGPGLHCEYIPPSTYIGKVYGPDVSCCLGYQNYPSCCTPFCGIPNLCKHGSTCISPNLCQCTGNWTYNHCDGDTSYVKWHENIIEFSKYLNYVPAVEIAFARVDDSGYYTWCDIQVHNVQSSRPITSKAAAHGLECKSPPNHCPSATIKYISKFWEQHPTLRKNGCFKADLNYHLSFLNGLLNYNNDFYDYVCGLQSSVVNELRQELDIICSEFPSDSFCRIKPALDLNVFEASSCLPSDKSQWTTETADYKKAATVSFAILKRMFPEFYGNLALNIDDVVVQCTNVILKAVQDKDIDHLTNFLRYMPPSDVLRLVHTSTNEVCSTSDNLCIFIMLVEQTQVYVDEAQPESNNGKRIVVVEANIDYKEYLRQLQLNEIIKAIKDLHATSLKIANDLKQLYESGFSSLRSYFETIEGFNQEIASADIGFIEGRIKLYQSSVGTILSNDIQKNIAFLLIKTLDAVGLQIAEDTVMLAMEIASACNPLKFLTGGTSASGVLSATAQLANTLASLATVRTIRESFEDVKTTTIAIASKFEKNDNFLENVKNLIQKETITREEFENSKNQFISKYNAYDPRVTKPELAEIGNVWENLVDSACSVLDGLSGNAAAIIKAEINEKGTCGKSKKAIARLMSTYDEIYDFQFDLMDAMLAYIRSSVALDAAKGIEIEYGDLASISNFDDVSLTTLQLMGVLTYVADRHHELKTCNSYCNLLEYKNGGVPVTKCNGVNSDKTGLIADDEPECQHSSQLQFLEVPTKPSDDVTKLPEIINTFIDLEKLFEGKNISFKIPSPDWLIEKGLILPSEKDDAIYITTLDVIMPVQPQGAITFKSDAFAIAENEITPGSTQYVISPDTPHMVYKYKISPQHMLCAENKKENPYTSHSCKGTNPSAICELSVTNTMSLYPSIYSKWTLSVESNENVTPPNPATDLNIIFRVKTCTVHRHAAATLYNSNAYKQQQNSCCPNGEYYQQSVFGCTQCPTNSISALEGYYCEKETA